MSVIEQPFTAPLPKPPEEREPKPEPPDPEDLTVAEVLERAADYIDEHGWRQRDAGGFGMSACVLGALWTIDWDGDRRIEYALKDALGVSCLPTWNDAPGRTKEEVTRLLRATAASLA